MTLLSTATPSPFGTIGTDLFAQGWGESKDGQIMVLEGQGFDAVLKDQYENPSFKVFVRGDKNEDSNIAHDRLRAIHEFLIVQVRQFINGFEYVEFEPTSRIISLGRDDENRANWWVSYYTFRESLL